MADSVSSQTLHDGPKNVVMAFRSISDGTGEAAVLKVDVSTLSGAPSRVRIKRIVYGTAGMGVDILWDATTDVLAWHLPTDTTDTLDFTEIGGLQNNAGSGITGDIMFTTIGHTAVDRYSVLLEMIKD